MLDLWEGSISSKNLIPLLSHRSDHQSCNNQCVGLLSSPSCSSWDVASVHILLECESDLHDSCLKIGRMVLSVTYCNLRISKPEELWCVDDLQCDQCGMSWQGLWLCPLWAEWDCYEQLLWWLHLSWCCDLEQPLCKLW